MLMLAPFSRRDYNKFQNIVILETTNSTDLHTVIFLLHSSSWRGNEEVEKM